MNPADKLAHEQAAQYGRALEVENERLKLRMAQSDGPGLAGKIIAATTIAALLAIAGAGLTIWKNDATRSGEVSAIRIAIEQQSTVTKSALDQLIKDGQERDKAIRTTENRLVGIESKISAFTDSFEAMRRDVADYRRDVADYRKEQAALGLQVERLSMQLNFTGAAPSKRQ